MDGTVRRVTADKRRIEAASWSNVAMRGGGDLGRPRGCRGEKPLEVADAIPPVAPRVDSVIAKPTGIAPGANRVRMNTQKASGLGDGEGRVGGTG